MNAANSILEIKSKLIRLRIQWPQDSSIKQDFALPFCIVYYAAKNPLSPKCFFKLIQSCKYFFEKLPILVVSSVMDKTKICCKDFYGDVYLHDKCCMKINYNKTFNKIWLPTEFFLNDYVGKDFFRILCSRIYRCDISVLNLHHQRVIFEDFKILAASAKFVELFDVFITYKNGSNVLFETILESMLKIEEFKYWFNTNFPVATHSTFKNVAQLQNLGTLKFLRLFSVPEISSLNNLISYFKDRKKTLLYLTFASKISDTYKNQLNALIDDLIEAKTASCFIIGTWGLRSEDIADMLRESCCN